MAYGLLDRYSPAQNEQTLAHILLSVWCHVMHLYLYVLFIICYLFTVLCAVGLQVYYVDHGFSEVISKTKLLELHEKFFKLPFQATKCTLAGEFSLKSLLQMTGHIWPWSEADKPEVCLYYRIPLVYMCFYIVNHIAKMCFQVNLQLISVSCTSAARIV